MFMVQRKRAIHYTHTHTHFSHQHLRSLCRSTLWPMRHDGAFTHTHTQKEAQVIAMQFYIFFLTLKHSLSLPRFLSVSAFLRFLVRFFFLHKFSFIEVSLLAILNLTDCCYVRIKREHSGYVKMKFT